MWKICKLARLLTHCLTWSGIREIFWLALANISSFNQFSFLSFSKKFGHFLYHASCYIPDIAMHHWHSVQCNTWQGSRSVSRTKAKSYAKILSLWSGAHSYSECVLMPDNWVRGIVCTACSPLLPVNNNKRACCADRSALRGSGPSGGGGGTCVLLHSYTLSAYKIGD
jgi:hypothetical protein